MLVKEDLVGIKERSGEVEESQKEMVNKQKDIQARLLNLEKDREKDKDRGPDTQRRAGPRHRPLGVDVGKNNENFIMARRSLHFSPLEPHSANVKDFLLTRMKVPQEVVADIMLSGIRKIHPKRLPAHRQGSNTSKKIIVNFRDSQECDMIVSYASNLTGDARMDVVIPDHLMSMRSQLDRLTYKIRKHASDNNKKVTTSIRLDDQSQGLVAAVREGKEGKWLYYTVQELEELESALYRGPVEEDSDEEECV